VKSMSKVPFPWAEVGLLPLSTAVAAGAMVSGILRAISLTRDYHVGVLVYGTVFAAAALGALFTCISVYFGLPLVSRALDFFGLLLLGGLMVYADSLLGGGSQTPAVQNIALLAILCAWLFASYTAGIIPRILPLEIPSGIDEVLRQRLWYEHLERKVYAVRDAYIASELAVRRVIDAITLLVIFVVGVNLVRPVATWIKDDWIFGIFAGLLITGLVVYSGLVRQASRRRIAEKKTDQITIPAYDRAWILGIGAPAAVAITGAVLLPANISPLYRIDFSSVMTRFTEWLVSILWHRMRTANIHRALGAQEMTVRPGFYGGGEEVMPVGGMGGVDPLGFILSMAAILFLILTIIFFFRYVHKNRKEILQMLLTEEEVRRRGFWGALKAILLLPLRLWRLWWRRHVKSAKERSVARSAHLLRDMMDAAGRKSLVLPKDPILFTRFIYSRMLKVAKRAGIARRSFETAEEFEHVLVSVSPASREAVGELTRNYCVARYGVKAPASSFTAKALGLLREVARGLRRINKKL